MKIEQCANHLQPRANYLYGLILHGYGDLYHPCFAAGGGYLYAKALSMYVDSSHNGSLVLAGMAGLFVAKELHDTFKRFLLRYQLHRDKQRTQDPNKFPLEHAHEVVIQDQRGLEHLLDRTMKRDALEWGTAFKAYPDTCDPRIIIIDDILDVDEAMKPGGLVSDPRRSSVTINLKEAWHQGYNGCHHYHPSRKRKDEEIIHMPMNYVPSLNDRQGGNSFKLLTFNMPEGPEIIGFNLRYVYIPADSSKQRLVRATPRDVMRYLA